MGYNIFPGIEKLYEKFFVPKHFRCIKTMNESETRIQLTLENSSCQGTKKIVRGIESSSFREMDLKQ